MEDRTRMDTIECRGVHCLTRKCRAKNPSQCLTEKCKAKHPSLNETMSHFLEIHYIDT